MFRSCVTWAFDTESHLAERGSQLIEKKWDPFGPGWYGDHNRIYRVRYKDRDGNEHEAHCKTHPLGGVYWTDDNVVGYAPGHAAPSTLVEENQRLKAEIERLKSSN